MLLYINGNEVCGGAKSINNHRIASDDPKYTGSGNKSHPENVMHSFGYYLSKMLGLGMRVEATVKSNDTVYKEVVDFVDVQLPKLRSWYTVIVVGWAPGASGEMLNQLATKLNDLNLEFIFFNTEEPIEDWEQSFSNLVDLQSQDLCFLTWCQTHGHNLKEDRYPDRQAHEQWAKYLFHLTVQEQEKSVDNQQ